MPHLPQLRLEPVFGELISGSLRVDEFIYSFYTESDLVKGGILLT